MVFSHICKIKQKKTLGNFNPTGNLGLLFKKAKLHNRYNEELIKELPSELSGLSLGLVENQKAFLVAKNASVSFRANKQKSKLLSILKKINGLSEVESVSIKVDEKNTS